MQKLTQRQKQLKREYMKMYRRLDKFSQAPISPLSKPSKRDVERIKQRYQTVHEYEKIYRRFERSVRSFNEIYRQNIRLQQPHTRIDTRTLQTLQEKYDEFKQFRRRFVRNIPREDETTYKNLMKYINEIITIHNIPNQFTGQLSFNDERIVNNAKDVRSIIEEKFPKNKMLRNAALRRVKFFWEEITDAIEKYIYYSDQDTVDDAEIVIVGLITGDNTKYTKMTGSAEEDDVYE